MEEGQERDASVVEQGHVIDDDDDDEDSVVLWWIPPISGCFLLLHTLNMKEKLQIYNPTVQ